MNSQITSAATDLTPISDLPTTLFGQLKFSGLVGVVLLIFSAGALVIANKTEMDMAPTGHLIGIIGALASTLVVNCAPRKTFDNGSLSFAILGPLMHLVALCLLLPFLNSDYRFINLFYYSTLINCNIAVILTGMLTVIITSAVAKRKLFSVKDWQLTTLWASLYLGCSFFLYSNLPRY